MAEKILNPDGEPFEAVVAAALRLTKRAPVSEPRRGEAPAERRPLVPREERQE